MKTRTILSLGLSALVFGGTMVGCTTLKGPLATASAHASDAEKRAAEEAREAEEALAENEVRDAVTHAEAAVSLAMRDAGYRALLGEAYLAAGRFRSAADALGDSLALDASGGHVALNLALARTALGDWSGARDVLRRHAADIADADRGLALALAGDPVGAVEILTRAARAPTANARVRQNLALSLALAGRWKEAKTVAAIDLPPIEADKRIMQWAAFARPDAASDQVAALLGVVPVADAGQPVRLALNDDGRQLAAVSQPVDPADAYIPAPAELPEPEPVVTASKPSVTFAARQEIVQALPQGYVVASERKPAPSPVRVARRPEPKPFATGSYFVQLGAFENAGVARDAWGRLTRRVASLKEMTPQGMHATTDAGSFYRLSVGGFARADADRLCREVKARGGRCFVRTGVGERLASWARGPQLASR